MAAAARTVEVGGGGHGGEPAIGVGGGGLGRTTTAAYDRRDVTAGEDAGEIEVAETTTAGEPVLVDVPLPPPATGNRRFYGKFCPHIIREITVNLLKDSIKYVEIENSPSKVVRPHDHPPDVRQTQRRAPSRGWKATTWSLPIPIVPCEDWHVDCTFDVADITIDPMHSELVPRLRSTGDNPSEPALPAHLIGFPTMSMDDDVLYLLYKAYRTGQTDVVIAVDMRKQTLQGFAKLAVGRDFTLTRNCTSEISKYL
ncbi:hypothetical protein ACQ4PT_065450 [Festuca glaucescens]